MGLDMAKLPKHVAIIMDGNGRWAKKRNLPRALGHRAGTERLTGIVRKTDELGIPYLTVYAFSTENWRRPKAEVDTLMELLREYFVKEIDELHRNRVKIRILGDMEGLPKGVRELLDAAVEKTALNDGLCFNIAFNYGGRAEVVHAARSLAEQYKEGRLNLEEINEEALMQSLYTAGQSDVDLVIRTSGERRLSNFLPLQTAYAELYFTDVYWPDFSDEEYLRALADFAGRDRRYGGVK